MREYHEVRKELSGDEAAPYMGLARTLLGSLKLRMHMGGLAQLSRTFTLPDGTMISVASRHGQDTIRIGAAVTPSAPGQEQPVAPPPFTIPQEEVRFPAVELPPGIVIAGLGYDGSHNATALLWKKTTVAQVLGRPFGSSASIARSVSADGRAVTGFAVVGPSSQLAFRWTAKGGFQNLGSTYAFTTGMSYNGEVIVGVDSSGDSDQAFYWTQQTGIVLLPAPVGAFYAQAWGVSGDGDTVVGLARYPGFIDRACTWDRKSRALTVLGPGDANAASVNGRILAGVIYGAGSLTSHPARWDGGVMTDLGTLPGGVQGAAQAISASGNVIVGDIEGSSSVDSRAFWWTPTTGLVSLGPGIAYGVSVDGALIVGRNATSPVLWGRNGNAKMLALPAGMVTGAAYAITNTAT